MYMAKKLMLQLGFLPNKYVIKTPLLYKKIEA